MSIALPVRPSWLWYVFPCLTMSLGWGLRGHIGGGPLGAMIPGAFLAMALCLLLRRQADAGFIAAAGAIGFAFGGQETYGQTVRLSLKSDTHAWAILGFALKGGMWGLLGGAFLGLGFTRDRFRPRDIVIGLALMAVATFAGWKLFNEPRLVYFSDPFDRPRPELWFGLYLGALAFLAWLTPQGDARLAWRFALWGLLSGALGFALGAKFQAWGRQNFPGETAIDWWKGMELIFGACLGLGLGHAAWLHRNELAETGEDSPAPPLLALLAGAAAAVTVIWLGPQIPIRCSFSILGGLLLALALRSTPFAWQLASAVTYTAFAYDFVRNRPDLNSYAVWTFVIATSVAMSLLTARRPEPRVHFPVLLAASIGISLLKTLFLTNITPAKGAFWVQMSFLLLGAATAACFQLTQRAAVAEPASLHHAG